MAEAVPGRWAGRETMMSSLRSSIRNRWPGAKRLLMVAAPFLIAVLAGAGHRWDVMRLP